MQFDLKSDFSIDDVHRYYYSHPVARKFTENGFSRDVAQSRHSKCVKDYVVWKALLNIQPRHQLNGLRIPMDPKHELYPKSLQQKYKSILTSMTRI